MRQDLSKNSGWKLYWVYSDGAEDCFVVARTRRSAINVECHSNGFDPAHVGAVLACHIPAGIAKRTRASLKKEKIRWPSYARDNLLRELGADFRVIEGRPEIYLNGTVYCPGERHRIIGTHFIDAFRRNKRISHQWEEDTLTERQQALYTLLGVCVARCQEIEDYIAESFILATSAKDKIHYKTIGDLIQGWKRKTLGQLIRIIEESYDLEPTFKVMLEWFLRSRNRLVHGLTTHPQYNVHTNWGQDEMVTFLTLFEMRSRVIRKAFRASCLCSIDCGNSFLSKTPNPKVRFTRQQKEEMHLFFHYFILRDQK